MNCISKSGFYQLDASTLFSIQQTEFGAELLSGKDITLRFYAGDWIFREIDNILVRLSSDSSGEIQILIHKYELLLEEISGHGASVGFILKALHLIRSGAYAVQVCCKNGKGLVIASHELPRLNFSHDIDYWANCWLAHGMVI